MRYPATLAFLAFALFVVACRVLPDRVYVEATESPISGTTWQDQVGGSDPVIGIGFEWALRPTEVVIAGQRAAHPWDLASAMGIYDGAIPDPPTPIVVEDPLLQAQLEVLTGTSAEVAEDVGVMRDATDAVVEEASAFNRLFLGGGGLVGFLVLLFGGRAYKKHRQSTPKEDTE